MTLLEGLAFAAISTGAVPATAVPDCFAKAGASVPFVQYEAEEAQSTGAPIGPDRTEGTLAAEASGRRAVLLDRADESIVITLTAPANALTIRYSLPDSADGKGLASRVALSVDGKQLAGVPLTSRFGWFYGRYPFTNRPGDGAPHHFWDEARVLLPRTLAAGSRLTLTHAGAAPWAAIDLIDAELAPAPLPAPANALSVTEFGADRSGRVSARNAFLRAIRAAQAQQRPLYIPPGRFRVDRHLEVDKVTIVGAGPWHSQLVGAGLGFYARRGGSGDVSLSSFAIESDVAERRDNAPLAAIGGTFSRSAFANLFLHHAKVGLWLDGPASGLTLRRLRITDMTADGINLHRGISDAVIEQNFIRNSGDDGIALWSHHSADARVEIRNNSVIAPMLANGIALYGGRDISVRDNLVADTVTQGGGIHLGARFGAAPFAGSIELAGNVLVRTGGFDPNWHFGVGALWLYALERPIGEARITVRDTLAIDSSCEAIQLLGPGSISGVSIEGFSAVRSGGPLLAAQTAGSISIAGAASSGAAVPAMVELPKGFTLVDGGGNGGWASARIAAPAPPTCATVNVSTSTYRRVAPHASAR